MSTFKKSDMQYSYDWTARPQDNPNFRLGSDYRNFNRGQGYEVLFVINEYLDKKGLTTVASGQKVEKLIREKLPSRVFSHSELYLWIDANW